jgi:hypothetical protein
MRLAYLTTDPVNLNLAERAAATLGATVDRFEPRDGRPGGEYAAVVYDLDYLPPALIGQVLADLLAARAKRVAAVHGYNLGAALRAALRRRDVVVARRPGGPVIRAVVRRHRRAVAGQPAGTAPPPGRAG